MNTIIADRDKLCELLNITKRTLKSFIYNNKLENELELNGYKLLNIFKNGDGRGKKIYYEIEIVNELKSIYINICKKYLNTRDYDTFAIYFKSRINNLNYPVSKLDIANFCGIPKISVMRWDSKLIELGVLSEDDVFHVGYKHIDVNENEILSIRSTCVKKFNFNFDNELSKQLKHVIDNLYGDVEYLQYDDLYEYIDINDIDITEDNLYKETNTNDYQDEEITLKELNTRLRCDFNNYIRPIFIKNKCEYCNSCKNLELHHDDIKFAQLVNDTLIDLGMKNNDKFNSKELRIIKDNMLGKQLKSKYITLCDKCHDKYHSIQNKDIKRATILIK